METPVQDLDNRPYHDIETPQWNNWMPANGPNLPGSEEKNASFDESTNATPGMVFKEINLNEKRNQANTESAAHEDSKNIFSQNYFNDNDIKIDSSMASLRKTTSYSMLQSNKENVTNQKVETDTFENHENRDPLEPKGYKSFPKKKVSKSKQPKPTKDLFGTTGEIPEKPSRQKRKSQSRKSKPNGSTHKETDSNLKPKIRNSSKDKIAEKKVAPRAKSPNMARLEE
jgi:hypothetical protein